MIIVFPKEMKFFNLEFSFFQTDCFINVREPYLLYYLVFEPWQGKW